MILLKQREEYLAKQEEEHQKAQQALFEETNKPQEVESIADADFHYSDLEEGIDSVEDTVEEQETPVVESQVVECVEEEESDFEKAARIAKEKQKVEGINIKEKQEYVSKFETFADSSSKQEEKASKSKYKKYD